MNKIFFGKGSVYHSYRYCVCFAVGTLSTKAKFNMHIKGTMLASFPCHYIKITVAQLPWLQFAYSIYEQSAACKNR